MDLVLLTGGNGFIGSHTCVELLNKGFSVCILDSLVNSSIKTISKIEEIFKNNNKNIKGKLFFRKGDLRDKIFLENVFTEFEKKIQPFNFVIHFAGLKSVNDSIKNPLQYWDVNINSTVNLLKTMDKFECNNLVFSSSATIYDSKLGLKLSEDSPVGPINAYGKTKLAIENILEDLFNSNNKKLKIANLRYFNPVGAHISGLIGENPKSKPTNLFPLISNVAKGETEYLSIFGKDWPTKDGTCIRDYIHVMDLADAHLAALDYLKNNENRVFLSINVGTGQGTSVLEIVNKFSEINKISVPFVFVDRREGDQAKVIADNNLALQILDWYPRRGISEMCLDTWRWLNSS